jgi:alanyl-tRNA synthetase
MTSDEIRERFLSYYERNGHARVSSSPVIPWGDPTLMFTNAGMNQFKDVFLGREKRDYVRATTCQRCIRAGGKHNDLDEVGRTTRHGTFLEMLGNFSFGDYFKEGAIGFAWEFITTEMKLVPDELYISIYSTDDEAYAIWHNKIGISDDHILRFGNIEKGDEENFWSMGPTGPCGPCSEIYIDRGKKYGPDDPYESLAINAPRFLELWNLVFMQFNRDETGEMNPLPKPSIDTGLGLERMAMVKQNRENIFETDILGRLVNRVEELTGRTYDEKTGMPFRVAADHVRTLTFAIADGAIPSNEGRGYVLRRILRRGSRYVRELGVHEPLLYRLVSDVVDLMGSAYPEIIDRADYISLVIKGEEERFLKTLDQGIDLFDRLVKDVTVKEERIISGEDAFRLYDTYGFPVDLTRVMAEEQNMTVDMAGFEKAMESQRTRAREASSFAAVQDEGGPWKETGNFPSEGTPFVGYETDSAQAVLIRWRESEDLLELVFDRTPFYALSGGQASDTGTITPFDDSYVLLVKDVRDYPDAGRVHLCEKGEGTFSLEKLVTHPAKLSIDSNKRRNTERNHSATHLLQAGLRKTLGTHVRQSGSAVDSERLRFDFNHFSAVTYDEIEAVEEFVNSAIMEDYPVTVIQTTLEEARSIGAMSLFEEKYGDVVRLLKMDEISLELCGGTHVTRTGRIGPFRIVSESSVAAGIRRIEAITGERAWQSIRNEHDLSRELSRLLNVPSDEISGRVETLSLKVRELEKQIKRMKTGGGGFGGTQDILNNYEEAKGIRVASGKVEAENVEDLKSFADKVREKIGSGVGILGAEIGGKVSVVVVVTDDLIKNRGLKAGDIVRKVAEKMDGSGGGRPHMAMAGGKDPQKLDAALAGALSIVSELAKG